MMRFGLIKFLIAAALIAVFLLDGCGWMKPRTYRGKFDFSGWSLTATQKDSLRSLFEEMGRLEKENRTLGAELEARELDLAKLRAENMNLQELILYQKQEIDNAKRDLEYVETQFINLEDGFQHGETKASAVATLAGASIALERVLGNEAVALDSTKARELRMKLARSETCLKNSQYTASVYYAKRVLREAEALERIAILGDIERETKIVATEVANLREGPGKNYKVIGKLAYGSILVQLDRKGSWCRVKSEGGKEGWVYGELIR